MVASSNTPLFASYGKLNKKQRLAPLLSHKVRIFYRLMTIYNTEANKESSDQQCKSSKDLVCLLVHSFQFNKSPPAPQQHGEDSVSTLV